jgi:hypothetical protein
VERQPPFTIIVIKPKIINSIDSSRKSLRTPNGRAINVRKPSIKEAMEETELMLKTTNRHVIPSGKR